MNFNATLDPDKPEALFSREVRAYAAVAQRMYHIPVVKFITPTEVIHEGVIGAWVAYGRNHELRKFIPKMYMILELGREKP